MMMTKKNSKSSAPELGNGRRENMQQQTCFPRSPLKVKDLNIPTSTSDSIEAPKGCLRFFLSPRHSSSAKNSCFSRQKSAVRTKPAPNDNVGNLRAQLGDQNVGCKKISNLQNPEKPTSRTEFELGFYDNAANCTLLNKLESGFCVDGGIKQDNAINSDIMNPRPPIQASLSPDLQCGSTSMVVTKSSPFNNAGHLLSGLNDKISRLWFEYELESVAELLERVTLSPDQEEPIMDSSRTSFGFTPLIKSTSIPESVVRISWREGLEIRMYEMDELDFCRFFSDDEVDTNECSLSAQNEDIIDTKVEDSYHLEGFNQFAEPTKQDQRRLQDLEKSGWKVCYQNHLFQV